MPQIYDMGPTALLPLRRKACWEFFRPKNPANLGTKGQHATPRPPQPIVLHYVNKTEETVSASRKYWREQYYVRSSGEKDLKEKGTWRDLGEDGRLVLQQILRKYNRITWTAFICPRTATSERSMVLRVALANWNPCWLSQKRTWPHKVCLFVIIKGDAGFEHTDNL